MATKNKKTGCTRRQEAFCQAYAIPTSPGWKKTAVSAREAGYTEKGSPNRGRELIKKAHIRARVDVIFKEWSKWNPAFNEDQILLKHINLMERAEKEGDLGEARANLIKIGEIGGIYKQRQLIQAEVVAVSVELPAGQSEAMRDAAKIYKLKMATEGDDPERGRNNPVKLIEATTYTPSDDKTEDVNKAIEQAIEDSKKDAVREDIAKTVEETERIPAHLVGRSPGKPQHSADNFR